jgi:hypothetical protein
MIIKAYFQNLFPFLFVTLTIYSVCLWFKLIKPKKMAHEILVLYISAFITFVPFTGLSLADFLLSVNPNFSIGSLALVLVLLWPRILDKPLLSTRYVWVFCCWNVFISLILFSSTLGLISYDIYALGYNFSWWFIAMALLTFASIWIWNPLSLIFVAYIAAFNLKVLPSSNFFDYITDGFLLTMSAGVLLFLAWQPKSSGLEGSYVEEGGQGSRTHAPSINLPPPTP